MKIRSLTAEEGTGVVVRYAINGEYGLQCGESVELPDDATLIDISFYGSRDRYTMQVVFEPAWPGMLPDMEALSRGEAA